MGYYGRVLKGPCRAFQTDVNYKNLLQFLPCDTACLQRLPERDGCCNSGGTQKRGQIHAFATIAAMLTRPSCRRAGSNVHRRPNTSSLARCTSSAFFTSRCQRPPIFFAAAAAALQRSVTAADGGCNPHDALHSPARPLHCVLYAGSAHKLLACR